MPRGTAAASRTGLVLRYAAFALVSMVANLAVQEAVFRLTGLLAPVLWPAALLGAMPAILLLLPAMAGGTIAGFAVKYVLDKRWIFADPYEDRGSELRKIGLYGLFSVATTLIFWAFEAAFWLTWQTTTAKYAGAVLGLCIGYVVKYWLDRRWTFARR